MKSPLLKALLLGLIIGILGLIVSPFPFSLDLEENTGLGLLFKLRGPRQAPADAVVVSIDKESSENLNLPDNPDKWPRSLHARLTEKLAEQGAKVIAFDVHFIEPRVPEDDRIFAQAIRKAGNVVLTEPLKTKEVPLHGEGNSYAPGHNIVRVVEPIDILARPAVATAPFTLPRIPFKVNQYWTFETAAGGSPTTPLMALQLYSIEEYEPFIDLVKKVSPAQAKGLSSDANSVLKEDGLKDLMKDIRAIFEADPLLSEKMLKEAETSATLSGEPEKRTSIESLIEMYSGSGSRYINYYGPPGTITTIPYYQALHIGEGEADGKRIDVRGKAVFVGLSEVLLAERKDSFYTVFSLPNGTFIGGVEIAATAFLNLLKNTPVRHLSPYSFFILIFLWGLLMGAICRISPIGVAAVSSVGLAVLYLFFAEHQFKINNLWYPIVVPLFFQTPLAFVGATVWNYIDTNKEKKNIRNAFEHYLPKDVVAQLAKDLTHIRTGSRVVYGVCLFTDAQHYTSLSETMDPQELGRFMNKYYETMFKPVKLNSGIVSGVIGDSMLALWVAASSDNTLKNNACLAALDINRQLQLFGESSETVKLKTRIGLHYGQILLGHIGALDHYEYTPMGDIVNTASRIEGLNKYLGTNLLVSEEVVHQLNGFLTRELGKFRLKGKIKPVTIHELLCRAEEADEKLRGACAAFAGALDAFNRQSWDEAMEKFLLTNKTIGEDGPSLFYLERCEHYLKNPPEEKWGGVVSMDKK